MKQSFDTYFTFLDDENIIYNSEKIYNLLCNNEFTVFPDIIFSF
jgi:hypothetical protein